MILKIVRSESALVGEPVLRRLARLAASLERSPEVVARLAEMLSYLAAGFGRSHLLAIDLNPVLVRLNPAMVTIVDARVA